MQTRCHALMRFPVTGPWLPPLQSFCNIPINVLCAQAQAQQPADHVWACSSVMPQAIALRPILEGLVHQQRPLQLSRKLPDSLNHYYFQTTAMTKGDLHTLKRTIARGGVPHLHQCCEIVTTRCPFPNIMSKTLSLWWRLGRGHSS